MAFHIEPYTGRGPLSLRKNLSYIQESYGNHPAFYKVNGKPFYYIYDSYITPATEWARLLKPGGDLTVRGTKLDAIFIGLIVDYKHRNQLKSAGFDGFYTYFGANGFSYGSTWKNWRSLAMFARKSSLIFIPSVAPGYDDMRVSFLNSFTAQQLVFYYFRLLKPRITLRSNFLFKRGWNSKRGGFHQYF